MKHLESFYHEKKVLVTGGAGFIGSHLVEKLVSLGAHVTIFDNFSTGKLDNLRSVLPHLSIFHSDITSAYNVQKATTHQDVVFHLAALTSVPQSIVHPAVCKKINFMGTKNVLEGCVQNNVSTMVFASSSAIYGNKDGICNEQDIPAPCTPYAQAKLDSEKLCTEYAQAHALKNASLRYFNVYGDRQNPTGPYAAVVAKFKKLLQENKPLTIYGDGTQTRDFIHVSEVVNATLQIATLDTLHGDIFNIGSGKSTNLLALIEQLKKDLKITKSNIVFDTAREGDILHSQANCNKYKQVMNNLQ